MADYTSLENTIRNLLGRHDPIVPRGDEGDHDKVQAQRRRHAEIKHKIIDET